MPKAKTYNKTGFNKNRRTKLKIGGRASVTGATSMTTAALVAALETCRPRDRSKIRLALSMRGATA
jgi:hypothetical protein